MYIPRPSGYWGASRAMCQSGRTYATPIRRTASTTRARERRRITSLRLVPGERDAAAPRGDPDVALHLLVQRRAEVGAVERVDAHRLRHPHQRPRGARHDEELGVERA